jgi:regulator of sigma E protease
MFTSLITAVFVDGSGVLSTLLGYGHTFFAAILVLGALIFVHELGHFLVAKKLGVGVEKFSLGFGPKIFGMQIGDTEYMLSAVPLGGYVKLAGEDPDEECQNKEHSFSESSVWSRLAIVSAGPLFNLLFAVLIFSIVYMVGVPTLAAAIGKVRDGSPALKAGLLVGDKITAIDGKPVKLWDELRETVHNSPNKELNFTISRNQKELDVVIIPESRKTKNLFGEDISVGLIGIEPESTFVTERYNPLLAVYKGFQKTWEITYLTVVAIKKLFQQVIPADTIGGPILILQMAGEQAKIGILNLVFFVALLSINLGILNLLPIPILDGGHILFFSIEAIFGKPIAAKKREIAQQVGIAMLLSLMVFAFYNDIMRIFFK